MTANAGTMALSASLEDYLEAIFQIVKVKQAARAKDISDRMQVSRSSVTGALHALAERELINYAPYDIVTLTDRGRTVAEDVVGRHEALRRFFVKILAVDDAEADAAACKLEHAIPEVILDRFALFIDFLEKCPRGGESWLTEFATYCENRKKSLNCEQCVAGILEAVRSGNMKQTAASGPATTLASVKPGQSCKIVKIGGVGGIRRRLLDMGATAGTRVEVERVAPLGDPMEIKLKGYHLTLRKEEARRIEVEL